MSCFLANVCCFKVENTLSHYFLKIGMLCLTVQPLKNQRGKVIEDYLVDLCIISSSV